MRVKDAVGRHGEDVATAHLTTAGLRVVARNWRCSLGEIDIVAVDGDCLVVCEVKTRRSVSRGTPIEAVTPQKVRRLRRLAAVWLKAQDQWFASVRIDVVAVVQPRNGPPRVEHLRGVG